MIGKPHLITTAEIHTRLDRLRAQGWSVSEFFNPRRLTMRLEGFAHEIAHCFVLGVFSPRSNYEISKMVETSVGSVADEILVTAVTITVLETYYGLRHETEESLRSCARNTYMLRNASDAWVIEHLNTPRCLELAQAVYAQIELGGVFL